jgi:hypothetical protein
MNRQGAVTQMRLCNHDRCIDPTNDQTNMHQHVAERPSVYLVSFSFTQDV